jgi:hypothetical protein
MGPHFVQYHGTKIQKNGQAENQMMNFKMGSFIRAIVSKKSCAFVRKQ